jgi:hypothetical protein
MERRVRVPAGERRSSEDTVRPVPSPGETLPAEVRAALEPRFGHDFGGVRVHADADADRAAHDVDARAFTLGSDVFFRAGEYDPETPHGVHLLAHELAHVVQDGRVGTSRDPISEPSDTAEAHAARAADAVLTGDRVDVGDSAPALVSRSWISDLSAITKLPGKVLGEGGAVLDPINAGLGWLGGVDKTMTSDSWAGRGSGLLNMGSSLAGMTKWLGKDTMPELGGALGGASGLMSAGASGLDAYSSFSKGDYGKGALDSLKSLGSGLSGLGSLGGFSLSSAGGLEAGAALTGSATAGSAGGLATALGSGGAVLGAGLAGYGAGTLLNEKTSVGDHTQTTLDYLDSALNWLDQPIGGKKKEGTWAGRKQEEMSNKWDNWDLLGAAGDALKLGGFATAGAVGGLAGGMGDAMSFLGGGWQQSLNKKLGL